MAAGGEDAWQGGGLRTGHVRWHLAVPHFHVDKPEEQLRRKTDHTTQGSREGKKSLQTSGCKNL